MSEAPASAAPVLHHRVAAARFLDPVRFERELASVFTAHWLVAARSEELPSEGAMAVTVARTDLLLTRDAEGTVSALHNVCSHRGAALTLERLEGERLRCPFHGWTYGLDGTLVNVPGERRFADLDRDACRIPSVGCAEWQGFVMVHLGTPTQPPGATLGAIGEELARYRLEGQRLVATRVEVVDVNWKAAVDAFNETYHVPFNHAATVGRLVSGPRSWFTYCGPHSRMVIPVRRTLAEAQGRREQGERGEPSDGKVLLDEQRHDHCDYTLFPNLIVDCLPTWSICLRFDPVDVGCTAIHVSMLADPPRSERGRASVERQWAEFSKVLDEDLVTLRLVARGMRSRAFGGVRLGGEEERLVRFHADVEAHLT